MFIGVTNRNSSFYGYYLYVKNSKKSYPLTSFDLTIYIKQIYYFRQNQRLSCESFFLGQYYRAEYNNKCVDRWYKIVILFLFTGLTFEIHHINNVIATWKNNWST